MEQEPPSLSVSGILAFMLPTFSVQVVFIILSARDSVGHKFKRDCCPTTVSVRRAKRISLSLHTQAQHYASTSKNIYTSTTFNHKGSTHAYVTNILTLTYLPAGTSSSDKSAATALATSSLSGVSGSATASVGLFMVAAALRRRQVVFLVG